MGPAVVLGQNLADLPRPVGDSAAADLAARDRKLRHRHGEAAGTWLLITSMRPAPLDDLDARPQLTPDSRQLRMFLCGGCRMLIHACHDPCAAAQVLSSCLAVGMRWHPVALGS
jgi:hypothetical protein